MDALQACNGDTSNAWIDVVGGLSPTRTLTRNFRVGGDLPATREDVQNDLPKCLDEWVGGLPLIKA